MGRLEQALGMLLILVILLDIFLTVLYARIGTSIIGFRGGWSGHPFSRHQSLWAPGKEPFCRSAARSCSCLRSLHIIIEACIRHRLRRFSPDAGPLTTKG